MWPDSLLRDLAAVDSANDFERAHSSRNSIARIMGLREKTANNSHGLASSSSGGLSWTTTETPFTPEEEDAIVTLVVVVIGIIVAIVILFSMGIFIDCKHQKEDALKKRKLKLRMPPISRTRKTEKDDVKSLAADMCPNGASDAGFRTRDAIV